MPRILVLNKVDLVEKPDLLPRIAALRREDGFADIVPISALTGENVERLEQVLLSHLPEGEPLYPDDYLTDQPERFFVAELVREQVLQQTHDELPFSTAVVVDKFEEPDAKGLMRFYCTILVERESQKPILVGKAGSMIKAIGTAARKELERFFDARVFLDLHVKVREDWREDERMLDRLGLPSKRHVAEVSAAIRIALRISPAALNICIGSLMAPQRRIDVVLDSVKRLLRIGATANLLNLLQKQHPADLAQVFGSLLDTERQAVFSLLVERKPAWRWKPSARWGPKRAPSC